MPEDEEEGDAEPRPRDRRERIKEPDVVRQAQQRDERREGVSGDDEALGPGVEAEQELLLVVARGLEDGVAALPQEQREHTGGHRGGAVAPYGVVVDDEYRGRDEVHELVDGVAVGRGVVVLLAPHHLLVKLLERLGRDSLRRPRSVLLGKTEHLREEPLAHRLHHGVVRHLLAHRGADGLRGYGLVGGAEVPPPVVAHPLRRVDELLLEQLEIVLDEIEGYEEPTGAHPRERDALVAEVVLEHPVVPTGLVEDHGPHGGEVVHRQRQVLRLHLVVHVLDPVLELLTDLLVHLLSLWGGDPPEELVHRAHRQRMSRKRPDDVGHPKGPLRVEPAHELPLAAHHAAGHAAAQGLTVDDHVRVNAVVLLRAAGCHAETGVNLVKHEGHLALGAHFPQLLEPNRVVVQRSRIGSLADRRGHQHQVVRGRGVRVEALERVDDDAGDFIFSGANRVERRGGHVLEWENVGDLTLVARSGLHAVPPAVVGAGEGDHELAPRVERGESDRAHDGLGARHVERHLVELGHRLDHREVLADDGVERAEHRAQVLGSL